MSKRKLSAGIAGVSLPLMILDTTSTSGGGLAGLVYNTAGLIAEYRRQGQNAWTAIALSVGTLGTWSSGGFVADGALAGAYELGAPDACFAGGARWVAIRLRGAANMLPCLVEIELDQINYQDSVRAGLSALPNAAAGSAGGLPTGDASGHVTPVPATVPAVDGSGRVTPVPATIPTTAQVLAAFKADTDWQTMLANVNGVFAFNPITGVLTLHDKANSVLLATLTLTKDGSGNILSRASA